MKFTCFIVGVRGSGKSTLLTRLSEHKNFSVLMPSTTRSKRSETDSEYHFVSSWDPEDYLWTIQVSGYKYGMSKQEFNKTVDDCVAVTVFDPSSIDILTNFRGQHEGELITIGLNTVDSLEEQHRRVAGDSSRQLDIKSFNKQKSIILNTDCVISGSEDEVLHGFIALCDAANGRGGMLGRSLITPLLNCGLLLENSSTKAKAASYDLRLGDDVWCQGRFSTLNDSNPTVRIPPYSYVIVSALELANLPSFIVARFDLKNSLFFKGVILSNGPQVDPGYRGALFCMLFNGSNSPVGITRGQHFASIEFLTTSGFDFGYRDKYQGKKRLVDFMPADAIVSEGGQLMEQTNRKLDKLEKKWETYRNAMFAVFAFVLSPLVLIYFNFIPFFNNADAVSKIQISNNEFHKEVNKLVKNSDQAIAANIENIAILEKQLKQYQNKSQNKGQTQFKKLDDDPEAVDAVFHVK